MRAVRELVSRFAFRWVYLWPWAIIESCRRVPLADLGRVAGVGLAAVRRAPNPRTLHLRRTDRARHCQSFRPGHPRHCRRDSCTVVVTPLRLSGCYGKLAIVVGGPWRFYVSVSDGSGSQAGTGEAVRLLGLVNSCWMTAAISAAADLGIPDLLVEGPRSSRELADTIGAHEPFLRRLLVALSTLDVCEARDDDMFALGPLGEVLRSDAPVSVRSWALYSGAEMWPIWGHLAEAVRTGRSGREIDSGVREFEFLDANPDSARRFHEAMVELTRLATPGIVAAYPFSGCRRVVDVGGGYGELLTAILDAHPSLTGILFDLPNTIDVAHGQVEQTAV